MTKFRVTDPVRIIAAPCRYHDLTGIVAEIVDGQRNPYRVDGLEPWPLWFGERDLILAEAPTPAAPSGAGEASGARVAPVDTEDARGAEAGTQWLLGGDMVEYIGDPDIWKVISPNIYGDKYVSIQCRNRIITSVPVEELRCIGRKK